MERNGIRVNERIIADSGICGAFRISEKNFVFCGTFSRFCIMVEIFLLRYTYPLPFLCVEEKRKKKKRIKKREHSFLLLTR